MHFRSFPAQSNQREVALSGSEMDKIMLPSPNDLRMLYASIQKLKSDPNKESYLKTLKSFEEFLSSYNAQLMREEPDPDFILVTKEIDNTLHSKKVLFSKYCYFVDFTLGNKTLSISFADYEEIMKLLEKKAQISQRLKELCRNSEKTKTLLREQSKNLDLAISKSQEQIEKNSKQLEVLEKKLHKKQNPKSLGLSFLSFQRRK